MTFIALPEIRHDVFGPLVGFRQQQPVGVVIVNKLTQSFDEPMCLGQVFAVRAFPLV
jgi:hypothetical protein